MNNNFDDLQREFKLTLENTKSLYKQALAITDMMSNGDEINALMGATLNQMKANGYEMEPLPTDHDVVTMLHLTQGVASTLRREAKSEEPKEPGAASINISLSKGVITVTHGEDGTVLSEWTANAGDWDKLWRTIIRLKLSA